MRLGEVFSKYKMYCIIRSRLFSTATSTSKVVFSDIVNRWPSLSDAERQAIKSNMKELTKGPWKNMTSDEKLTSYFVTYGFEPKSDPSEWKKVLFGTVALTGIATIVFFLLKSFVCKLFLSVYH
jgi:hypothetical protein